MSRQIVPPFRGRLSIMINMQQADPGDVQRPTPVPSTKPQRAVSGHRGADHRNFIALRRGLAARRRGCTRSYDPPSGWPHQAPKDTRAPRRVGSRRIRAILTMTGMKVVINATKRLRADYLDPGGRPVSRLATCAGDS